jgi:two-component system cell cycle sensor histidine kinase/response regulator CckA
MKNDRKTKNELIAELESVRQKVKKLETLLKKRKHTEKNITERKPEGREQIRRLATIVRDSNDAIMVCDLEGRISAWNRGAELMYGYSEGEALQMNVGHLTPPDREPERKQFTRRLRAGEAITSLETQRVTKDNRILDVWLTVTKLVDDTGKPIGIASTERDITERKRAVEALATSESRYRRLFEAARDGILILDADTGMVVDVNPFLVELLGYSREQFLGKRLWELGFFKDIAANKLHLAELQQKEFVQYEDVPLETAKGCLINVEFVSHVYRVGRHKLIQCNVRDITERNRAKHDLQERVKELKCVAEISRLAEQPGISTEEFVKQSAALLPSAWQYPEDACAQITLAAAVFKTENFKESAWSQSADLHVDGQKIGRVTVCYLKEMPAADEGPFLKEERGLINVVAEFLSHVIQHRQTDKTIRESETKFRTIFNRATDGMLLANLETKVFFDGNQTICEMLGYSQEEIKTLGVTDIHPKESLPYVMDQFEKQSRGETVFAKDIPVKRKDGSVFYAEVSSGSIALSGRQYLIGIFRDITERKQAEEALRSLTSRYQAILTAVPDIIMEVDKNKVYSWANRAGYEFFGEDVIGKEAESYFVGEQKTYDRVQPLFNGKEDVAYVESWQRRKDGEQRLLAWWCRVLKDSSGHVSGALSTARDITELRRAEESLHLQAAALESAANSMVITDSEGTIRWVNPAFTKMTGYSSSEVLGQNPKILKSGLQDRRFYKQLWNTILSGKVWQGQVTNRRKNGEHYVEEMTITPVQDGDGKITNFIAIKQDITDRKRAEEALRESKEQYQQLVENINEVIFSLDRNGVLTYVSPAASAVFGFNTAELIGYSFSDFILQEDLNVAQIGFQRVLKGELGPSDFRVRTKSGEYRWVHSSSRPVVKEGEVHGINGVLVDITERKQAEEALTQERNLLRALMDNVPDHIYFKDTDSHFVRISKAQAERFGLSDPAQAVGKTDFDFFTEEHARLAYEDEQEIIRTGQPLVGLEEKETWPDARETWVSTTKLPLRNIDGQIIGTFGISRDITEGKRAEDTLRENEQRLTVALTCADIAVFSQDKDLRYTWMFNPQLGFLPEEVIGKSDKDLFSRADVSRLIKIKQKVLETGVGASEEVLMTLDHQEIVILLNIEPLRDSSGAIIGLTGAMIDITQRKLAELEIRRNREWLQAILDASRDGIVAEKGETIAYANASFARVYGYDDPAELIGKHATVVLAPEESRRLMDFGRRRLLGESVPNAYEFKGMRKDGKAVQLEASVSTAFVAGEEYIISTVRDISERKLLQRQLVEAQKMESIGTLAGGIAHDFNNILGIIMGHSSLLERTRENAEKFAQSADAISKATFRGAGLVRQLLTFARKADVVMQSVLINDTLKELAKLLEEILPKTIVLQLDLGEKLPSIHADPTQMHQVFLNLCVNARDAMTPKGGTLTLTSRLVSGEAVSMKFSRADAMEYILVDAADSGTGMDAATRSRIFEPFFTTKEKGKGTGLGLATVYGIVESHRGFIDVESTLGVGSTFHVYLPVEPRQVKRDELEKVAEKEIQGGTETILAVEDEETLRDLICLVLESKGYKVLQASDGDEGLQQFTEHQQEIGLVLSDLGLPKMSGGDLLNRIRELKPKAKIILATGYVEPGMKSELLKSGAKEIIQKPYVPVEVLRKIREVLDSDE